jgi:class 3 adenylate cyclase
LRPAIEAPVSVRLAAQVGIATGTVVVDDLVGQGAAKQRGRSGQPAARLQAIADPGTAVIAASTRQLLGGLFDLRDLVVQTLTGFAEPRRIWAVESASLSDSRLRQIRSSPDRRGDKFRGLRAHWRREETLARVIAIKSTRG